jgi:hypothetical protein
MRKRIITPSHMDSKLPDWDWLNIEEVAELEITSEDAAHPIESALLQSRSGWLAAEPGKQIIRIIFAAPQRIQRIWIHFEETGIERTQQFELRWSPDGGKSFIEIARQQWNFSPRVATSEIEDYSVDLSGVTVLELNINPDISGGSALASLAYLRLAS